MERVSRGDVVLAAAAGDFGKPRPWLVVQADVFNATERPGSVLVCPFTTHEEPAAYRVPFDLPAGDSIRRSWVMADKLTAMRRARIGAWIARASTEQLLAVDAALTAAPLGLGSD